MWLVGDGAQSWFTDIVTENDVSEFQYSPSADAKLDTTKGKKKIENPHFIYTDPNMKRYDFKGLTTTPIPLKQS